MKRIWTSWLHSSATPRTGGNVPVWSVPAENAATFFRVAYAVWVVGVVRIGYKLVEQGDAPPAGWVGLVDFGLVVAIEFGKALVGLAGLAMLLTPVVTKTGGAAMTFYQAMVNRWVIPVIERHKAEGRAEGLQLGKAEGMAEGKAEGMKKGVKRGLKRGRARAHDEWAAWNQRRVEAERQGRDFDESPPGS